MATLLRNVGHVLSPMLLPHLLLHLLRIMDLIELQGAVLLSILLFFLSQVLLLWRLLSNWCLLSLRRLKISGLLILQTWQIWYLYLLLLLPFPVIGFVDSGATSHMSGDIFLFLSLSPLPIKNSVSIADGTLLPLSHCGSMSSFRIFHDILYFPPLRTNLLSFSHLAANHLRVIFSSSECLIQDQRTGRIVGLSSLPEVRCSYLWHPYGLCLTQHSASLAIVHSSLKPKNDSEAARIPQSQQLKWASPSTLGCLHILWKRRRHFSYALRVRDGIFLSGLSEWCTRYWLGTASLRSDWT